MPPVAVTQAFIDAGTALVNGTSYIFTENVNMYNPFTFAGDGTGITVDGNGHIVTVLNRLDWTGLFSSAITVQNLGISSVESVLYTGSGWFFGNGVGGVATNCYSTGLIEQQTGGIFGDYSSGTAINCYSTGTINGGGIFGNNSSGTATNCYSTGIIRGGGIFGDYSSGTATNCYSTGIILDGGIFGGGSSGTASNCYSTGNIAYSKGGIFGSESTGTAINCYSTGSIGGGGAGGIFGADSTGTVLNSGNSTGWNDTDARRYLTGYPGRIPRVWTSTTPNTAYQFYVPCFPAGTRILTAAGYKTVESLVQGELVLTADGRQVPVKIYGKHLPETTTVTAPFRIPKGTFGLANDLVLSPDHAFQIRKGLWMLPKRAALLSDRVEQIGVGAPVTYYHLECPQYLRDNLVVDGTVVESYGGKTKSPYTYSESLKGYTRAAVAATTTFLAKA